MKCVFMSHWGFSLLSSVHSVTACSLVPQQTEELWSSLSLSSCLSIGPHTLLVCWEGREEGGERDGRRGSPTFRCISYATTPQTGRAPRSRKEACEWLWTGIKLGQTHSSLINAPALFQCCFNLGKSGQAGHLLSCEWQKNKNKWGVWIITLLAGVTTEDGEYSCSYGIKYIYFGCDSCSLPSENNTRRRDSLCPNVWMSCGEGNEQALLVFRLQNEIFHFICVLKRKGLNY